MCPVRSCTVVYGCRTGLWIYEMLNLNIEFTGCLFTVESSSDHCGWPLCQPTFSKKTERLGVHEEAPPNVRQRYYFRTTWYLPKENMENMLT